MTTAEGYAARQVPGTGRPETESASSGLVDTLGGIGQGVKDGLDGAAATVTETVEAARETAQAVQVAVRDGGRALAGAFDVTAQARERPWLFVGAALLAGVLAGCLLTGRHR
jgi:ElaB/YqjD/DUF883 family membrane-anchored ribosome-binding protein